MRILVTGGTGFLGSHLVRALLEKGHHLVLLRRSQSRLDRLAGLLSSLETYAVDEVPIREALRRAGPSDAVVNLATCYGRQGESDLAVFEANLLFPLTVLGAAEEAGVPLFLNTDTSLLPSSGRYALSKKQFVRWGELAAERGGIAFTNVALEHFYGPGDDPSKFVAFLVRSFLQNLPEIALTEGRQERDFVYIDDVVAALVLLLERQENAPQPFSEFQLGSGQAVTIRSLVELLKELTGAATVLRFGAVPYRPQEQMFSCADISALAALGWAPRETLEGGLQKTLNGELSR